MYDNSLGRRISAMSIIICYLKSVKVGRLWECSSKGRTYLTHIDVTPLYIREGRLDAIEKSTFGLPNGFVLFLRILLSQTADIILENQRQTTVARSATNTLFQKIFGVWKSHPCSSFFVQWNILQFVNG